MALFKFIYIIYTIYTSYYLPYSFLYINTALPSVLPTIRPDSVNSVYYRSLYLEARRQG